MGKSTENHVDPLLIWGDVGVFREIEDDVWGTAPSGRVLQQVVQLDVQHIGWIGRGSESEQQEAFGICEFTLMAVCSLWSKSNKVGQNRSDQGFMESQR